MPTANTLFSVSSFIAFVLCCIPFRRHLQACNIGTCLLMAWNGAACLMYFVNSIIWNSNSNNSAPVWCDISSWFGNAVAVAVPAAILCIHRRLYYMVMTGNTLVTQAEKRRAVILDFALGIGIPVIAAILLYIPQEGRFLLYEDFGCLSDVNNTSVGICLQVGPQLLVSLVCAVYAIVTIRKLHKKRLGIRELLHSNSNITTGSYLRLLIIAIIGSVVLVPLCLWLFISSWSTVEPWQGLKKTHADMSYVQEIPASVWRSNPSTLYVTEITRWEYVICALIFFACFGLHKEARESYRSAMRDLATYLPCLPATRALESHDATSAPAGNLPLVFARDSDEQRNKAIISTLTSTYAGTTTEALSHGGHTLSSYGLTLTEEVNPLEAAQSIPSSTKPETQVTLSMPP